MALSFKDSTRNARLDRITADLGSTAVLEVFAGAPTGKAGGTFNADPATRLVSIPLANPVAPPSSAGVLTFTTLPPTAAIASGTPGSFRLKSAAAGAPSTVVVEGIAGIGSGDMVFSSGFVVGGTISIPSMIFTEGNA